jgi:Homing endonuclease associated repeat
MLVEAGLPLPPRRQPRWTAERIVSAIRAWERAQGRPPRACDFATATPASPHRVTVVERFGSFRRALEAARVGVVSSYPPSES